MTVKPLFVLFFLCLAFRGYAQKRHIPADINEALAKMPALVSDTVLKRSKTLGQQEFLTLCETWNSEYKDVLYNWLNEADDKPTKLAKYYIARGITYQSHMEAIISLSLYRHLHGMPLRHDSLVRHYMLVEKKWDEEDRLRPTADSLRGVYIPKNLTECFKQINSLWNDSTKLRAKQMPENEFRASMHHGFGTWMRNNWQLWGGSRLSAYFNAMGIYHPDDMSAIILTTYHRILNLRAPEVGKQIKHYQNYWKKLKNE